MSSYAERLRKWGPRKAKLMLLAARIECWILDDEPRWRDLEEMQQELADMVDELSKELYPDEQ